MKKKILLTLLITTFIKNPAGAKSNFPFPDTPPLASLNTSSGGGRAISMSIFQLRMGYGFGCIFSQGYFVSTKGLKKEPPSRLFRYCGVEIVPEMISELNEVNEYRRAPDETASCWMSSIRLSDQDLEKEPYMSPALCGLRPETRNEIRRIYSKTK